MPVPAWTSFVNAASFKQILCNRNILWIACGLAAAWLLFWYVVPLMTPLPAGLSQSEDPGAVVLDCRGTRLATLPGKDYYYTEPMTFAELPDMLMQATLAAEDKRFFSHGGADFLALARALMDNISGGQVLSGASTITQQLAKNASNAQSSRSLSDKVREFFQARHMELTMSKGEILENYFNRLDYGNLRRGPAAAARFYFGRAPKNLSLAECALLAGLPQGPSRLNPLTHPERALERRNHVLQRLREEGLFPEDMLARAEQEPLFSLSLDERCTSVAPHVISSYIRAGRTGVVRTTLDADLQRHAQRIVQKELERLQGHHVQQAAVMVVENATGHILCLIGSGDRVHPAGGLLDGTATRRSAGSTLKPFVYAQAFLMGAYPGTMMPDIPTTYRSAHGLEAPRNYNNAHMGPISVRKALACSQNIPAMRALGQFGGAARLLALLKKMGMTGIEQKAAYYGLGLAIGNAEVTLRELTAAYVCLARGGTCKTLVLEPGNGEVADSPASILPGEVCWLVADIMADREARLATFGDHEFLALPFRYALKTGTSSDFRDNWCVGFTRELTVAVWVGNFDASPMQAVGGISGAAPIFAGIMKQAHQSRSASFLEPTGSLSRIRIDARTGKRIGDMQIKPQYIREEWTCRSSMPSLASEADYDASGHAYLDSRYTEWFTSPSCTVKDVYCLLPNRWSGEKPRILVPLDGSRLILDPEIPGGGRTLKLHSNLPTGAQWSSPSLNIIQQGDEARLDLKPGIHVIQVKHPALGLEQQSTITVRQL